MSQPPDAAMSFWSHLDELRRRLFRSLFAVLIGCGVSWVYRERLLAWLTKPFSLAWAANHLPQGAALHFPAPASLFFAYMKIAVMGGVVLALPVVLYQIWSFIAPGLYQRERRLAVPFVLASSGLFAAGGYFGWRVAFPIAFQYLLSFSGRLAGSDMTLMPTVMVDEYLDFVGQMLLAFGLIFELPIFVLFLSLAGLVTHRHLIKYIRHFVVLAFIIAAVVTPPDIVSQLLMAVPLCGLYIVSIGVAWLFGRRRPAAAEPPPENPA